MGRRISMTVSVHEAAHAVARAHTRGHHTLTVARADGSGYSEGSGETIRGGQYAVWDQLIVILSGGLAEARFSERSAVMIFTTTARDDWCQAEPLLEWLVGAGYAVDLEEAYLRVRDEATQMLKHRWPEVMRFAAVLCRDGSGVFLASPENPLDVNLIR